MNVLDENVKEAQADLLRDWRIHFRRVGVEIGRMGTKDDNVIPLLHELGSVTFFTCDVDYNDRRLCHRAYCLVYLDVKVPNVAAMIRRFLRHPRFRNRADRIGTVVRVLPTGLHVWRRNAKKVEVVAWPKQK